MAANMSGGGFSNYFDRPNYQDVEVVKYLDLFPALHDGLYECVLAAKLTTVILSFLTL